MNFKGYTEMIALVALNSTVLDGENCCDFNSGFYERLSSYLPPERIEEFAKIYGRKVEVDYGDFKTICDTLWVNRNKQHRESPKLWDVIDSLRETCEHHFF